MPAWKHRDDGELTNPKVVDAMHPRAMCSRLRLCSMVASMAEHHQSAGSVLATPVSQNGMSLSRAVTAALKPPWRGMWLPTVNGSNALAIDLVKPPIFTLSLGESKPNLLNVSARAGCKGKVLEPCGHTMSHLSAVVRAGLCNTRSCMPIAVCNLTASVWIV